MTAKLEEVRFKNGAYQACFDHRQYNYSLQKYGSVAEDLAKASLKARKRLLNLVEIKDGHAEMRVWSAKLQREFTVLFDAEDIDKVQAAKWFIEVPTNSRTYYAASDTFHKLHRYLLDLKDNNLVVDHINRNGLDDRKENLRVVTNSINKRNSDPRATNEFHQNGISYEIDPKGNRYVRASWMEDDGKVHSRKWSMAKYPNAVELAIQTRRQMEEQLGYVS